MTERISQSSSIATALVNITTSTQELIYAEDINLAVDIVSTLNKYGHLIMRMSRLMFYYIIVVLQKLLFLTLLLMIHCLR